MRCLNAVRSIVHGGSDSPRTKGLSSFLLILLLCPATVASAESAEKSGGRSNRVMEVEFVTPEPARHNKKFDDLNPLVTTSGWVLTVKLGTRVPAGIGQAQAIADYPTNTTGFLVFDDPDGCFSPVCNRFGATACGLDPSAACPPADETMVEFTPDSDAPGVEDPVHGNPIVQLSQAQPAPTLFVFDGELGEMGSNTFPIKLGPQKNNESVLDGYGPGPDDDLPGLVLLADSGFGLEFDSGDADQDGDITEVRGARNLAGLFDTIGYTLSPRDGGINLFAQMKMFNELLSAQVLLDEGLAPDGCAGGHGILLRVNGGAPFSYPSTLIPDGFAVPFNPVVTLRAFLVEGIAPGRIDDLDGNGVMDSKDAELAGFRLLSNEAVMEVEQYYQHAEDLLAPTRFDLDGDGFAACTPLEAPGGPGTVTPPPR